MPSQADYKLSPSQVLELRFLRSLSPDTLRSIRENAHITQAEVAHACGVHFGTVSKWELGERRPTTRSALKYARLLRKLMVTS